MSSIKISTGLKVYDIEDENGNIRGQISFNPSDMNFFPRANEMYTRIMQAVDEIEMLPDDMSETDVIQKMEEYDTRIKQEINTLFDDDNTSQVVFGNQSCFNTLNGESFIERFLDAFMPIIKKEFEAEQKKSAKRISKYTSQVN